MAEVVALFGAAGKMGGRIAQKLAGLADYEVLHVEAGPAGMDRLRARGVEPVPKDAAAARADLVVLAIPDKLIGTAAASLVPRLRPGAMLVCLDPAAPHAGMLPERADVSYFVTHPCHPPVINDEATPEARADCFGGVAGQHVVCALMQGPESDYARGEALVRRMFAPVLNVHRVTVEQMAILEPALSETVVLTFMCAMAEAVEEAARQGVPAQVARDFVLGHMHVNVGILFGFIDAQVSDGAKLAVKRGMAQLLRPGWKHVFQPESVLEQARAIVDG